MTQKVLLTSKEVNIILHRLACQLIENHLDFSDTILVGIQPRGTFLAERLKNLLEQEYNTPEIKLGYLDITFFRDDFRRTEKPLEANKTKLNFIVEGKKVIFIDDVLSSTNHYGLNAGFYSIEIVDAHGCSWEQELEVLYNDSNLNTGIKFVIQDKNRKWIPEEKVPQWRIDQEEKRIKDNNVYIKKKELEEKELK